MQYGTKIPRKASPKSAYHPIRGCQPLLRFPSEASREIHLWIIVILYLSCQIPVYLYILWPRKDEAMQASTANSRTERYMARVKAYLPALASDAVRRDFISCEIDKWEERYTRFIATEGASHRLSDASDQPTACDFIETLAALGAMQARLATDSNPLNG